MIYPHNRLHSHLVHSLLTRSFLDMSRQVQEITPINEAGLGEKKSEDIHTPRINCSND